MARRPKSEQEAKSTLGRVADAFLRAVKATPRSHALPLGGMTRARRGGYLFVARPDEAAGMDPRIGPASVDSPYPHLYEPEFVAEIARCALGADSSAPMGCVASAGDAAMYLFSPAATDALAELTPERLDFTRSRLDEIAALLMKSPSVPPRMQPGGAMGAALTLRTYCLEAREGPGQEVYYWWWQRGV